MSKNQYCPHCWHLASVHIWGKSGICFSCDKPYGYPPDARLLTREEVEHFQEMIAISSELNSLDEKEDYAQWEYERGRDE